MFQVYTAFVSFWAKTKGCTLIASMTANWSSKEGSALCLPPLVYIITPFSYHSLTRNVLSLPDSVGSNSERGWALALIRLSTLLHCVFLHESTFLMLLFFHPRSPSLVFFFLFVLCCRWDCQHFGGRHLWQGDAVHWPSQVCELSVSGCLSSSLGNCCFLSNKKQKPLRACFGLWY